VKIVLKKKDREQDGSKQSYEHCRQEGDAGSWLGKAAGPTH
jgi:hypothetical protein